MSFGLFYMLKLAIIVFSSSSCFAMYAVISIKSGDDIKTIQSNLGHSSAAFTLDVYGHCTEEMKKASANRMESYMKVVMNR